ncbi:hypothetical protein J18TS1_38340 [Oceanobacillus oncorhynchi subsp. incaldanensis]|uniref:Uncharacterized protein n=2 Tax=Oceanobacillus TaxID=182709 RepID=A0A0A1MLT4_9BACI|nr:hypothetical protein [Oceanobacillus oncorhynchi]MDM8098941.1 hypothetical protein [Oceanobacillus oncorhynchi]GIO20734.1 hypothetical protein J18TS1_38340 [Oceanobacillus oncorhynchi subsp. incaldanensis]CEI80642.1 hypothetical protein BN997_00449 [Oceanobacillus oncorhynchi]
MGKNIERGQTITFRIPSDTPDYLLRQLQQLKETERRNFSSKIASFVLKGVNEMTVREKETVTIPLPRQLTKEQKSWLKHEHSEALIGTILYQLLSDPMRATALLTSMNSGVETLFKEIEEPSSTVPEIEEESLQEDWSMDDLSAGDLMIHPAEEEEKEEEEPDPLGDFFSSMNK